MEFRELTRIDEVPAAQWNALAGTDCPFLRHEFLAALEHHGCVGAGTGWTPSHLTLHEGGRLVAAAPVYRKNHSWGEFVFDFSWAQAYERHGLPYYPKLLCAVPFSPVTANRLLTHPAGEVRVLRRALIDALERRCEADAASSAHALFLDPQEHDEFREAGWLLRTDVQFHWHNHDYQDFEQYLATFRADKRKQMRRERRRVAEAGIRFLTLHGDAITPGQLRFAYEMHVRTFLQHGHTPYLSLEFFEETATLLGRALMIKLAMRDEEPVAAAIFLASSSTLYGRYWGAAADFHSLHFETCYHQGIEYCIANGLTRFEPGTQGEHKIVRGFEPATTRSAHYVRDARFREAIATFLQREQRAVEHYAEAASQHVPFRRP